MSHAWDFSVMLEILQWPFDTRSHHVKRYAPEFFVGQLVFLSLKRLIQTELNTQTFCAQAVSGTPTSPRGSRLRQQRHPMTSHCDMTHFGIHFFRNRGSNDNQAGLWTNCVDSVKSSNRTTVMTGRVWISWVSQRRSALQDKAEWKVGSVKCYQEFLGRDSDWCFILFILEFV